MLVKTKYFNSLSSYTNWCSTTLKSHYYVIGIKGLTFDNKMYSLSKSSEIVDKIDDLLTMKVYFSSDLPGELSNTKIYLPRFTRRI